MKKILILMLAAMVVFSLLAIVSSAEESALVADGESAVNDEIQPESGAPNREEPATWSETFTRWITANLDYIFSAGCFALSAVVMWLFKKGLIPQVITAVGKISDATNEAKTKLGEAADGNSAEMKRFVEKFTPVLEQVEQYSGAFEAATREISRSKSEKEALLASLEESNKLMLMMIEGSRMPESVKEAARLSKTKQDAYIEQLRKAGEAS